MGSCATLPRYPSASLVPGQIPSHHRPTDSSSGLKTSQNLDIDALLLSCHKAVAKEISKSSRTKNALKYWHIFSATVRRSYNCEDTATTPLSPSDEISWMHLAMVVDGSKGGILMRVDWEMTFVTLSAAYHRCIMNTHSGPAPLLHTIRERQPYDRVTSCTTGSALGHACHVKSDYFSLMCQ